MPISGRDIQVPNISLHEFLWDRLLKYGDDTAFIDCSRNDKTITYSEIYKRSRKCATYLQGQGIEKGDFVAICAPNCLEYSYLIPGILGSGASATPCNPNYKIGEILQQFRISEPKMVFVSVGAMDTMLAVQAELKCLQKIMIIGESDQFTTVDEILSNTEAEALREVEINPAEDIAIVPHSSGTTGLPKAVMMTHRNYVTMQCLDSRPRNPAISSYVDRPMYHTAGFGAVIGYMAAGSRCVFESDFEVHKMLGAIQRHNVTAAVCVPPNLIDLVNADGLGNYDLSCFKAIACAGAITAPDIIKRIMEKYKVAFVSVYGMTEGGAVTMGVIPGVEYTSSGMIRPGVELKIVDPETRDECPPERDGEILIKSAQVTKGYLKNQSATAAAFDKDGWFKTGDIGHLGTNQQLYVVDRLKDIIKYKTFQVSPAELESVILSHPKVLDVGVIGIPDATAGELPKAFVVTKDASLTAAEIHSFVQEHLVDYKHLRGGVEFVGKIPKSFLGKILRNVLRKWPGE